MYVIFGATGGIGTDLAKRLLAGKSTVILAAHQGEKLSKLKEELGGGETKEIDVMNSKQVSSLSYSLSLLRCRSHFNTCISIQLTPCLSPCLCKAGMEF